MVIYELTLIGNASCIATLLYHLSYGGLMKNIDALNKKFKTVFPELESSLLFLVLAYRAIYQSLDQDGFDRKPHINAPKSQALIDRLGSAEESIVIDVSLKLASFYLTFDESLNADSLSAGMVNGLYRLINNKDFSESEKGLFSQLALDVVEHERFSHVDCGDGAEEYFERIKGNDRKGALSILSEVDNFLLAA